MSNAVTPGATVTLAQNLGLTKNPNRRAFLSTALLAAASATFAGGDSLAIESAPDPIFAAIERHRIAYAAYVATLGEDHLEEYIPREQRKSSHWDAANGVSDWRVPTDHPDWIAHIEQGAAAEIESRDAACALLSTEGLTLSGVLALLNYAKERSTNDYGEFWDDVEVDGKRETWTYAMLCRVTEALAVLV